MRVMESAHFLEWLDWSYPVLRRRYEIRKRLHCRCRAASARDCASARRGASWRWPMPIETCIDDCPSGLRSLRGWSPCKDDRDVQILILLLAVISVVGLVAKRLQIPPAILLVVTGVGLALIPGLPTLELAPDLVLVLVLPPIIDRHAVKMSWKEFRFNLRPIALLAIGCVVFTTVAVAAATHFLLGFPWAVGFVLVYHFSSRRRGTAGDRATNAASQTPPRRSRGAKDLPTMRRRLRSIAFAVPAVSVGSFSFVNAVGSFAAILAGEVVWGIGVGWLMLRLRRWVRDPGVEFMLSILTPFIAYWLPEQLGGSGVLATVAAGLYVSWNGHRLIAAATRLPGIVFWDFLTYLIEGMVFLITGLQARTLIPFIRHYSIAELAMAAALVCVVIIVTRFVWVYPATYLPRWLVPAIKRYDPSPPWQQPFLLAFKGVPAVLAAALAIPFTLADGSPFPYCDLILILTFCVIFVTLVGEGLTLGYSDPCARPRQCGTSGATGRVGAGVRSPQAGNRCGDRTARRARREPGSFPWLSSDRSARAIATGLKTLSIARMATIITKSSPNSGTTSNLL